jgi:hypothetical protein
MTSALSVTYSIILDIEVRQDSLARRLDEISSDVTIFVLAGRPWLDTLMSTSHAHGSLSLVRRLFYGTEKQHLLVPGIQDENRRI